MAQSLDNEQRLQRELVEQSRAEDLKLHNQVSTLTAEAHRSSESCVRCRRNTQQSGPICNERHGSCDDVSTKIAFLQETLDAMRQEVSDK